MSPLTPAWVYNVAIVLAIVAIALIVELAPAVRERRARLRRRPVSTARRGARR